MKSYYQCCYASPVTSNPIGAERNCWCLLATRSTIAEEFTDGWPGRQGAREMTLLTLMRDKLGNKDGRSTRGRTMADGEHIHLHDGARSCNFLMESGAMGDGVFEKVTVRNISASEEKERKHKRIKTSSAMTQQLLSLSQHLCNYAAVVIKKHICFDCRGNVVKFVSDIVNIIKRISFHMWFYLLFPLRMSSFYLCADSSVA